MIYQKTEAGNIAFKTRSTELSSRQRSAFLLFDGHRALSDVLKATNGLGITAPDIDDLVHKGFLAPASAVSAASPPSAPPVAAAVSPDRAPAAESELPTETVETLTPMQRYQQAYPVATRITAQLGLRGFKLNLAVEAASGYEDLVALLPKIGMAAGDRAAAELKRALGM